MSPKMRLSSRFGTRFDHPQPLLLSEERLLHAPRPHEINDVGSKALFKSVCYSIYRDQTP